MILKEKLNEVVTKVSNFVGENKEAIELHVAAVVKANEYKNIDTRIACDLFRACFSCRVICEWYDQYRCNDEHITTIALRAYKESGADAIVSRVLANIKAA